MKTTIELDDDLFRRSKAEAALRGQSLKDFFTAALLDYLDDVRGPEARTRGWRTVFGAAPWGNIEQVDAVVREEFERIDPEAWK
jgi:hypothetical protein